MTADRAVRLTPRAYRWLDRTSKLTGVALLTAGLAVGGETATGLTLAAAGVACGLATVFIDTP